MFFIGNENKQNVNVSLIPQEEVMRMLLEQYVLQLLFLLFCDFVMVTVIAIALFIALVIIIRKQEKEQEKK